jgi:hypothetical protein
VATVATHCSTWAQTSGSSRTVMRNPAASCVWKRGTSSSGRIRDFRFNAAPCRPRSGRSSWTSRISWARQADFAHRQACHWIKQLAGLRDGGSEAPFEGAVIWLWGRPMAGYVTSSFASPVLGKAVMLGWLRLASMASCLMKCYHRWPVSCDALPIRHFMIKEGSPRM